MSLAFYDGGTINFDCSGYSSGYSDYSYGDTSTKYIQWTDDSTTTQPYSTVGYPSYPQPSYPQPSYPQPSYPQPSYPQPSYPRPVIVPDIEGVEEAAKKILIADSEQKPVEPEPEPEPEIDESEYEVEEGEINIGDITDEW